MCPPLEISELPTESRAVRLLINICKPKINLQKIQSYNMERILCSVKSIGLPLHWGSALV